MSQTIDRAFRRIDSEYNVAAGPEAQRSAVRPFSAARTYDKLMGLTAVVIAAGILSWLFIPQGIAFAAIFVAFGVTLVTWFRPAAARWVAPVYAVAEGVALGGISAAYATLGSGIVPAAVIATAAVFVGCLAAYKSGLVRPGRKMMAFAMIGAFAIMIMAGVTLILSLVSTSFNLGPLAVVISVVCLVIGIASLFTDFAYVQRSEAMGVSADAEWMAAFAMLTALVLVYISILRVLAALYGGNAGRRN